jgi:hypothetical protein
MNKYVLINITLLVATITAINIFPHGIALGITLGCFVGSCFCSVKSYMNNRST